MDIIITLPSHIEWEDYQKELNDVKNGKSVLNFKVNNFPKLSKVGDKCYLNYKGNIIGWMCIIGFSEKDFICNITGKKWQGKFIERSGPFYSINPIPMKGFQGFRYFNLSENFINKFNDYINESLRDKMKPKSEEEILSTIKDLSPNEILKKGVKFGSLMLVKIALERGADIHTNNDYALLWAIEESDIPMIKYLINNGADVNARNGSPLTTASQINISNENAFQIIDILIAAGADVHANNDAAYRGAKGYGEREIMDYLKTYMDKTNESIRDKMIPKEGSKEKISKLNDKLISMMIEDKYFDTYEEAYEFINHDDIFDMIAHMAGLGLDIDEIYIEITQFQLDEYLYNKNLPLKFAFSEDIKDNINIIGSDTYNKKHKLFYYEDDKKREERDILRKNIINHQETNESLRDLMTPKSEDEIVQNLKKYTPEELLLKGCKDGELWMVNKALKDGADVNYVNDICLYWACMYGHYNVVRKLLSVGSKVTDNLISWVKDSWGEKKGIVNLLYKYKTNESLIDLMKPKSEEEIIKKIKNFSPSKKLEVGYQNKIWELVKQAIEEGANVHMNGDSALRQSCSDGNLDMVKYLLDKGANLHIFEDDCLLRACYSGNLELVKFLVDKGADIHAGQTEKILIGACSEGNLEIVEYLLDKGADSRKITSSDVTFGKNRREILNLLNKYEQTYRYDK